MAIELFPRDAAYYHFRGISFEAVGQRAEAIADLRSALSIDLNMQGSKDALVRLDAAPRR
jgi:hypothetical protein